MSTYLIVASSSGKNLELAQKIKEHTSQSDHSFEVIDLESLNLPLYTPKEDRENGVPDRAVELTKKFQSADGFVFLAPEYNGSTPPLFNNTIAWVSRSLEDWREAFNEKPAVVGTHSGGGGHQVLLHMQEQLSFIGCNIIGRKILTSYAKELNLDSLTSVLNQLYKFS